MMAEVTPGWAITKAIAICVSDIPACSAMGMRRFLSSRVALRVSSGWLLERQNGDFQSKFNISTGSSSGSANQNNDGA
jgi:hypothetical protein